MPEVYRDREETHWLTAPWDELLTQTRDAANNAYTTHLDPATAEPEYLDWLAQHYGFTEEFWDTTWSESIKRTLLQNAYGYIWPERGTIGVLNWMIRLHALPAVLPDRAAYYPDWFRAFDWVLIQTRDFAETWTEADGTTSDLLAEILAAIAVMPTEMEGDTIVLPYGGDGLHRADVDRAISLYDLPYTTTYDQFFAGVSVAGDRAFVRAAYAPDSIPVRDRSHPDIQVTHYPALRDPFRYAIRLDAEIVSRGDATWALAERIAETYAPIWMKGGVCFDYFRAGRSVAGDPSFDPDYDFSYPIAQANHGATTIALFEQLIAAYGWDAIVTQTAGQFPATIIRFRDGQTDPDRYRLNVARKLSRWYAPYGEARGSGASWDYFYSGLSVAGDPVFDWLGEIVEPVIAGLVDPEALMVAILVALGSTGSIASEYVIFARDCDPSDWARVRQAIGRYAPSYWIAYDYFYAGLSVAGDPVFAPGQ